MKYNTIKVVVDVIKNYLYYDFDINPTIYAVNYAVNTTALVSRIIFSTSNNEKLSTITEFENYFNSMGFGTIDREVFKIVGLTFPSEISKEIVSETDSLKSNPEFAIA